MCLLSFFLVSFSFAQNISYDVEKNIDSPNYGRISIEGIEPAVLDQLSQKNLEDTQWATFFSLSVHDATRPMIGSWSVENEAIIFNPRFLPDPEVSYTLHFSHDVLRSVVPDYRTSGEFEWSIDFSEAKRTANIVVAVHPESSLLPANILRFYVHFAAPVGLENPFDFIKIEHENGDNIVEPFVEMEEGLWSSDRKRLTLLVHPGRIKRGVGPNMTTGEVFRKGESYRLVISPEWELDKAFTKAFTIVDAVRDKIDVAEWKLNLPQPGTRNPLIITSKVQLDHALAERLIAIEDSNTRRITGEVQVGKDGRELRFTPAGSWSSGPFFVAVDSELEDICGNTPISAFDVEGEGEKVARGKIRKEFYLEK